jgi:hypothetical protein
VFGDVVLGKEGGSMRLCPASSLVWCTHDDLVDSLRPLLDLPVEHVLVSHGDPVIGTGHEALFEIFA